MAADGRLKLAACHHLHVVAPVAVCRLLAAVAEVRRAADRLVRMAPQEEGRVARPPDMAALQWAGMQAVVPAALLSLQIGAALREVFAAVGCAFDEAGANDDLLVDGVAEQGRSQPIQTTGVHG